MKFVSVTYCGWDTPPSVPLPGVRSFVEQSPVNRGIDSYVVQAVRKGQPNNLLNLATREPWKEEDFAGGIPGGKYLWARILNPAKDPVDWADEARWTLIGDKLRLLGSIATRLGCDGVLLDIEAYLGSPSLFKPRSEKDYELAKRRGKELQPGIALLFHRLLSHLIDVVRQQDVDLDGHLYGLLPSFASGLIDGGCDLTDFCGTNRPRLPQAVRDQNAAIRETLPAVLGVDYRSVKIGQSVYLDQYLKPNATEFYPMLQAYYDCSDVGVLLYGEGARLCDPNPHIHASPTPYRLWSESLPGFSDSLLRATNLAALAKEKTQELKSALSAPRTGRLSLKIDGYWPVDEPIMIPDNCHFDCSGAELTYVGSGKSPVLLWVRGSEDVVIDCGVLDGNATPGINVLAVSGIASTKRNRHVIVNHPVIRGARIDLAVESRNQLLYSGGGKGLTLQCKCHGVIVNDPIIEDCDVGLSVEAAVSDDRSNCGVVINGPMIRDCSRAAIFLGGANGAGSTVDPGNYEKSLYPGVQINGGMAVNCATDAVVVPGVGVRENWEVNGVIANRVANGVEINGLSVRNEHRATIVRGEIANSSIRLVVTTNAIESLFDFRAIPTLDAAANDMQLNVRLQAWLQNRSARESYGYLARGTKGFDRSLIEVDYRGFSGRGLVTDLSQRVRCRFRDFQQLSEFPTSPSQAFVEDYGAKADGVTDDSPAFNQCIAEIPDGSEIRLRPGKTYCIGETVVLSKSRLILNARGATVKKLPGIAAPLFSDNHAAADGLRVIGGTYDGSREAFKGGDLGSAFFLSRTVDVQFSDVTCERFIDDGLKFYKVQRARISGTFRNIYNCGVELSAPDVDGFAGSRADQDCTDIYIDPASTFRDIQDALGGAGNAVGVYLAAGSKTKTVKRVRVGGYFENCYRGVQAESSAESLATEDVTILPGSHFCRCSGVGVALVGVHCGSVCGCLFREMGTKDSSAASDISGVIISRVIQKLTSRYIHVSDNVIVDSREKPMMEYGILLTAGEFLNVHSNTIVGAKVKAVAVTAQSVVNSTVQNVVAN